MVLSSKEVISLITNPDKAAEFAHLLYVSEDHLQIVRKKKNGSFQYYKKAERIKDPKTLERIKKLVIPPAWENVRVCAIDIGHLQVTGIDQKNRKQYMYHPTWTQVRNKTKFFKMASFGKMLPKIRAQVDKDLDLPKMNQRKVLALVIRLMEETHIRIGNDCYARENKSYGLSTLRSRHVEVSRGKMKFHFIGKKGKEHSISVRNKKLIKLVNQCEDIPGWEVFKYYDEAGQKQSIDSGMVNKYIQEITGELFSAKDFRTWSASKIFFETLREIGYTEDEKENKSNIIKAYDAAAQALGNTRSVCRSYYVHPHIVQLYGSGQIEPYFKKIKLKNTKNYASLSGTEKVMLDLISDFEINLDDSEEENLKN